MKFARNVSKSYLYCFKFIIFKIDDNFKCFIVKNGKGGSSSQNYEKIEKK